MQDASGELVTCWFPVFLRNRDILLRGCRYGAFAGGERSKVGASPLHEVLPHCARLRHGAVYCLWHCRLYGVFICVRTVRSVSQSFGAHTREIITLNLPHSDGFSAAMLVKMCLCFALLLTYPGALLVCFEFALSFMCVRVQ